MAKVLFYIPADTGIEEQIQREIVFEVLSEEIEICRTIASLSARLLVFGNKPDIAVLFAVTRRELSALYSIRHLLSDLRFIIVLPDRQKDSVSLGHALYPRFLSYVDGDFKDVAAVLAKMTENIRKEVSGTQAVNISYN